MPLPTPNEGESESDFISRCMANETMNTDFPQQAQRSAVCFRQWREGKGIEMDEQAGTTGTDDVQVDDNEPGKALSLERLQSRIYDAWSAQFPPPQPEVIAERDSYITEMFDEYVIISAGGVHWKIDYTDDGETVTFAPRDEWQKVKEDRQWVDTKNALKAISRTDDELRVGNRIIVFGGRDLEGVGSPRVNPDGTTGEHFTPTTDLSSIYTKAGILYQDWEHAQGEAGDELLGFVDWKTAKIDDKGVFVERVLNRRNQYVQWLDELGWFDDGTLGTSSHAEPNGVEKAANGEIVRWPLVRDTITVTPMEPRMMTENNLVAFKALGLLTPDDNEPEQPEASPEADTSAVDVARAKARVQLTLIELMEDR